MRTHLGHANASITLGWYAHDATSLLGNLLAGNAPTSENAAETLAEGVETEGENVSTVYSTGVIRGTKETGQPIMWLTCENLVAGAGFEPTTSGL